MNALGKTKEAFHIILFFSLALLGATSCDFASQSDFRSATSPAATQPPTPQAVYPPQVANPTPSLSVELPRPSSAENMVVCPNFNTLPGIDTSGHQPNIQWSSVQKAGQVYGYVKATEGLTFANTAFLNDWSIIRTVGMARGAYHYFHASDDPVDQANFFLSAIGSMVDDDLPPALDWEVDDNAGMQANIQGALIWLDTIERATGKTPLIYTTARFFNKLGNPIEFARYPLWIAETEVICPKIPPPWRNYAIWQWSMRHVSGVKTVVDLDLFNGSNDQLDRFTHNGTLSR